MRKVLRKIFMVGVRLLEDRVLGGGDTSRRMGNINYGRLLVEYLCIQEIGALHFMD